MVRREAQTGSRPGDGEGLDDTELARLFRDAAQQAIAAHLAAGRPVYYGGSGAESGRLFMRLPDGRRFEYSLRMDGMPEIVREVGV
jgi:hypothetical protein